MSKTERDLDLEINALDDGLLDEVDDVDGVEDVDDYFDESDDDIDDIVDIDVADEVAADTADDPVDEYVEDVADDDSDMDVADAQLLLDDASGEFDVVEARSGDDPLIAREGVTPEVSDDVLDELRRADIDGPTVKMAPQDDTSSAIRRPRRSPDYDPAPFPIPMNLPRMLGRKPRVRRVTRVVRHVDPWSVFKIAFVANIVLYLIVLTAGVLLWNVAYATGTVDNVERFFESFGWSSFEFNGGQIYHNAWIGGLFVVIGLTGLAVLMATLFNLITDLVGGMRFTVLEEEVVEARTSPMRRFVVRRAEPEVPHVSYDESGAIVREAIVDDSGSLPR
jgi:hypothetical protein